MTSLEDRLQRLEAEMDHLKPSLRERIEKLEQTTASARATPSPTPPPTGWKGAFAVAGKRFLGWMGAELPKFLTAIVLLVVGWGIKDSVDLSIKQRQLDLSYAKEMQGLLQKMADKDAEMAQLESTAVVLAAYGEATLPPLLSELRFGGLRTNAAVTGLMSLALTHPDAVCAALPRVLGNRSRQYDWQAQMKVVRLLGENGCIKALKPLLAYRDVVATAAAGKTAEFEEMVRALPLTSEDYTHLLATIDRSVGLLKQQ